MPEQTPYHASLYRTEPVPEGRLHAKLMDPDWQGGFRLCAWAAYDSVREWLISLRVESADRGEKFAFSLAILDQLRQFLVDSAEDAASYGIYAGPGAMKDAYVAACKMFAVMKERLDSGRDAVPIQSLAYIHAKLTGEDPAKLVQDADELWKAAVAKTKPAAPPMPKNEGPTEEESRLLRELKRRSLKIPARLVEFMATRTEVDMQDIGKPVHDHEQTDADTIGANCRKTNAVAEHLGLSLRYACRSEMVFKDYESTNR